MIECHEINKIWAPCLYIANRTYTSVVFGWRVYFISLLILNELLVEIFYIFGRSWRGVSIIVCFSAVKPIDTCYRCTFPTVTVDIPCVSCGSRSRCAKPLSILTGRTIQFSHICHSVLLVQNRAVFAVEMPSTVSTPHSKFKVNCARQFRDMNIQKLA